METYMVISADGREYGPATVETLRRWQAEGRIDGSTTLRASDGRLLTVSKLEPGHVPPPVLPPYPSAAARPSQQAPVAILLLVGAMGMCIVLTLLSIAIPNFRKAREVSERIRADKVADAQSFAAMQNARVIVASLARYAEVSNARLPALDDSKKVQEVLSPYVLDPKLRQDVGRYEFNADLSTTVPGRLANPELIWLVKDPKVNDVGQNAVCMVDGECVMLTPTQFKYRCLAFKPEFQSGATANSPAPPPAAR